MLNAEFWESLYVRELPCLQTDLDCRSDNAESGKGITKGEAEKMLVLSKSNSLPLWFV